MLEHLEEDDITPDLGEPDGPSTSTLTGKTLSKCAKKRARKANIEAKTIADHRSQAADGWSPNIIELETKQQIYERRRQPFKVKEPMELCLPSSGLISMDASTPVLP